MQPVDRHCRHARRTETVKTVLAALMVAAMLTGPTLSGAHAADEAAAPAAGPSSPAQPQSQSPSQDASAARERLPAPRSVVREIDIAGKPLRYVTTAGSIPLRDANGALQAEVAYVAYVRRDADDKAGSGNGSKSASDGARGSAAARPITFVFNGGPGASSAWLNFGALGPRTVSFGNQGDAPSDAPLLRDNPETWLPFTDLVFIDPPGTGFSRLASDKEALRKNFWSVDGDIKGLARVVSRYLTDTGRLTSPKYLVGESYGGFRAPKLASALQTGEGIGVNGVVMLSPVLDFARLGAQTDPVIGQAALLPSMAAARLERDGKLTPEALKAAEDYARGPYVADLLRGPRDADAQRRINAKVAEFTGLDPALVARLGGRLDGRTFSREFRRDGTGKGQNEVVSQYDGNVSGPDPWPMSLMARNEDPILDGAQAPLASAAVDEITRTIGWRPEGRYHLLSDRVNRGWDWGGGLRPPEALSDLRAALALDPKMKVLVVHGYGDLVTPYFQSKFDLDSLPAIGGADRTPLRVYPGGHMFYTRESSRRAFLEDARKLYPAGKAAETPGAAPERGR
ncbi:S10 family peptidase [Camelimonas lactis]|uniref:Carboxypeptidase C (Cathepsin A) n=1 Tax=Camelimonas lactis TaxID=659006 RepID=A0A4R2GWR9_9HYPH|nr:peptidase S10 [Camelimonas lactis]TCO15293.1 carboxypeptidase C (cathepsin A) [Camelimonas lactis]